MFLLAVNYLPAQEGHNEHGINEEQGSDTKPHEKPKFNPGNFIMEHVADSYEWHILTVGEKHVSVPLPVILYSKNKGLNDNALKIKSKITLFLNLKGYTE